MGTTIREGLRAHPVGSQKTFLGSFGLTPRMGHGSRKLIVASPQSAFWRRERGVHDASKAEPGRRRLPTPITFVSRAEIGAFFRN